MSSIPTINEINEHLEHDLSDDAIQRLIDDAEEEIVARFGAHASYTETLLGGGQFLFPTRPVSTVTSIVEIVSETETTLATNDYQSQNGGKVFKRLQNGTNGAKLWAPEVRFTYVPVLSWDTRKRVIIDLVQLAIQHRGIQSERIGDYSAEYANYHAAREEILNVLGRRRRQVA